MNLMQVEKRFQSCELRASILKYKYNPSTKRVAGLPKHIYSEQLKVDRETDNIVFGRDAWQEGDSATDLP